ncbi:hypothetical protein [Pseudomonas purpurea]|uniref:hypothetical protein n=1 Tax=Pseudomonas purpurea TaxID=3136737 RepID=UPI0032669EA8
MPRTETALPTLPPLNVRDAATALPSASATGTNPLQAFHLSTHSSTFLPAPDGDGFRIHAQRRYADLQSGGTVHVDFDTAAGLYRAKLRHERTASGPALRLNADGQTWRLASPTDTLNAEPQPANSTMNPSVAHRGQPVGQRTYIDIAHYVWNPQATNLQGYVVMHRKRDADQSVGPETQLAFPDIDGKFVSVEPTGRPIDQPAQQLPAWTDRDIWDFYDLQGGDISRFRAEVALTGKKPQWGRTSVEPTKHTPPAPRTPALAIPSGERGSVCQANGAAQPFVRAIVGDARQSGHQLEYRSTERSPQTHIERSATRAQ